MEPVDDERRVATLPPRLEEPGEVGMIRQDRWEEIHRLSGEQVPIAEIARRFDLDRKTVRRCLRQEQWQPYRRPERTDTLLAEHADFLRQRAPQVRYSARILFQELCKQHGYTGSYETVKLFVRPLRAEEAVADLTQRRFETPPGAQSQIDWGQARVYFRARPVELHVFVLTLGFSRRGFYRAVPRRAARPVPRRPRGGLRALRRPHARASLRPARARSARAARAARSSGMRPSRRSPTTGASSRASADPTAPRPRARSRAG